MRRLHCLYLMAVLILMSTSMSEARWYSPAAGRFLSVDPLGYAGGDVNLYRFAGNNPVNWVDPWGLWAEDVHSGIGNSSYGTYTWARESGISDKRARVIAIANNAVDAGPGTHWFPIAGDQSILIRGIYFRAI